MMMSPAQKRHMVARFLSWVLPPGFNPDGGVRFERELNGRERGPGEWPVGTNLLDGEQAMAMVEHMLIGIDNANAVESGESKRSLADVSANIRDLTRTLNAVLHEAVVAHDLRVEIDIDHLERTRTATAYSIPRLRVRAIQVWPITDNRDFCAIVGVWI